MNQPLDPFSAQLGRLLDDAAASFDPTPDPGRLHRMLGGGARRRGGVILFSAAASLALLGGATWALQGGGQSGRIAPAQSTEHEAPTRTSEKPLEPETTDERPDETDGPDHTEPKDTEPKDTEPKDTEPKDTEPDGTEPPKDETTTSKPGQDPPTTPKPTDPPTTEPHDTEPPDTEPPATDPPVEYEWSAFQTYGECEASPPFDVFYGTAAPGAKIVIEAAYGRKVGYANESGHWEIRIEFPEAPIGEPFQVWVASNGNLDDFWFKRLG